MQQTTLSTESVVAGKPRDMQRILAMAVRTVSELGAASNRLNERLDQIEQQIEDAAAIDGMRVLRFRLAECLQGLREQARHQCQQMSQALAQLQGQLEVAQGVKSLEASQLAPGLDVLTGLEVREPAEAALAAAIEQRGPCYAALFVVDRLHLINAQFGYSTGDQILRRVGEHLRSSLLSGDRLFRWTGPAFVALLERTEAPAEVQVEIERIASAKLKAAVQIGNGSIMLPIARASLLIPLAGVSGPAELTKRMDEFTGEQARH
jgi:diguanylate cyclase (GGDEF)-like protein